MKQNKSPSGRPENRISNKVWMTRTPLATLIGAAFMTNTGTAPGFAAVLGPYSADSNTVHLWNFDQNPSPFTNAVGGASSLTPTGGTAGATTYTGFGSGYSLGTTDNGNIAKSSAVTLSSLVGASGAFTFEAVIQLSALNGVNDEMQIIGRDDNGNNRAFQFRIKSPSGASGATLSFVRINGGVQDLEAAVPTTGTNAWDSTSFFHVAATYNGTDNTANNFKLYWTKIQSTATSASELLSTTLTQDLTNGLAPNGPPITNTNGNAAGTYPIDIGNRASSAATPNENLRGVIDNVRISNVARTSSQFIFGPNVSMRLTSTGSPATLTNLADSTDTNDNVTTGNTGTGGAANVVNVTGSNGSYTSEIDGLTVAPTSATSGSVKVNNTITSPTLVLLYLTDLTADATDDIANLKTSLGTGGGLYTIETSGSDFTTLSSAGAYGSFTWLVRFNSTLAADQSFEFNFAGANVGLDRIAVIPEPGTVTSLIGLTGMIALGRRRRTA